MTKFLRWYDTWFLKILVGFLIIFTALYPKLPSVHIIRTWVYIRLEDFSILFAAVIWFIQLLRRKVSIPIWLTVAIGGYWLIGLISTFFSILFIGPHLANYFPHLALLEDLRRVEYMILFFIAFSTVKNVKDIRDYFIVLCITVFGIVIYGFGQRYYLDLWSAFPKFFEKYSFCFPSFQTGNEEFAKGIPLCLPRGARITSTFGGHYDLAAYLVFVLPILFTVFIAIKKWYLKVLIFLLFLSGLVLLIFTSSRTSFVAYLFAAIAAVIFYKKKWFIIPLVLVSAVVLLSFSQSTAQRFLETIRFSSVVTNSQGQLIGETTGSLPTDLENKISKNAVVVEQPPPAQNLQTGSAFIGLPGQSNPVSTNMAVVQKTVSADEAKKLNLANGSVQVSTVSGSFLIRKALVYDISFTTRFQAEWPNAWNAFLRNPLLGSGYSSITLATDNDYLRALGETGLLGFMAFVFVFIIFGIGLHEVSPSVNSSLTKAWIFGVAGGVIGLALNATLIDVFESSKVAENLWLMAGIGMGGLYLYKHKAIPYLQKLKTVLTSDIFMAIYFLCLTAAAFMGSIGNFFVGDDFTWLHWAASSTTSDIKTYFLNSQHFFYRPLDKTIVFFLYNFLSFQPQGYHLFIILLHFLVVLGVYLLAKQILSNKYFGFLIAMLFMLLPVHAESIFWFSSISIVLSAVFIIYLLLAFLRFRRKGSIIAYILAIILAVLSFVTYEISVIIPLVFLVVDVFITKPKWKLKTWLSYVPFVLFVPAYFVVREITHAFSGGGDYSYSIPHLLPNFFGNIFGYLGLFLSGEAFLPFYDTLRTAMKVNVLLFAIIFLLICAIIAISVYSSKKKFIKACKAKAGQEIIFGIVFAIVSLLPFLGLGNIAERYIYLASFGLCLALVVLLSQVIALFGKQSRKHANWILLIIIIVVSVWYQSENFAEQYAWQQSGQTTLNMLTFLRLNDDGLTPADTVYFVNVPVKQNNAWVLPVGLPDAMWFIYRDEMPVVHQVTSLEQAESEIQKNNSKNNYIFSFGKNGKVTRVE